MNPARSSRQTNHSLSQFAYENPLQFREWVEKSNYIVILSTENESHLKEIKEKLINRGITFSQFIEPDMDNQLTSIAISPIHSDEIQRMFSSLPLAGKQRKEATLPITEKKEDIIFHFNKKHIEDPTIPMWVVKYKGETYYVHHVDVAPGVGFSTKETPDKSTKGSIKFKGKFSIITENGLIIGKIN